jgi:hypothetical protein
MIILIFIGIGILIFASYYWVKFVWFVFTPKNKVAEKIIEPTNPYIEAQKTIMDNDKNYEDYLDWFQKHGTGVPVDKIKHQKEIDFENQYKKYI